MEFARRQKRLSHGRRITLNCTLKPETHDTLGKIAKGNRSAAIELLVQHYLTAEREEHQLHFQNTN